MEFTNFLLVYPEIPETYWSYKHALSFIGKRALMPPLGLATIAAMIPDQFNCRILDMNVEALSDDDLLGSDMVLVSAMLIQKASFHEVIARCNRLGVPVAAGGPYPTSCPEQMSGVDHLVLNEGEITFPRFLTDYQLGRAKSLYSDERRPDIKRSPVPRFDLLQLDLYDTLPFQFSRGCPYHCEFCDIVHLFGNVPRTKSPEQFVRELDAAYRTGFRGSVFIVDDNFIGNHREVKELLRVVAAWQVEHRLPFHFSTEASIDLAADEELLDLMVDAGFVMVFVGIESPAEESLKEAGKSQNLRIDVGEAIRRIQRRGIDVTAGFIIGFDTDPADIYDRQIQFVQQLSIPVAMVGLLMALPHTLLWERLSREGRMLSGSDGNNTHGISMNFQPRRDTAEIVAGYRRVLREVYRPSRYFARCLALLRIYPEHLPDEDRRADRKIGFRELSGLGKSLSRQIFSWYGLAYLSYIVRALLLRPAYVVRIFTMAVQGHHFFTITRMMLRAETVREPVRTGARSFASERIGSRSVAISGMTHAVGR
ncbi:MAG TPA: radical SAM protein [Spirochaetia bacterium]|nr:radical SAM protein [Spirochaetia bacterium]